MAAGKVNVLRKNSDLCGTGAVRGGVSRCGGLVFGVKDGDFGRRLEAKRVFEGQWRGGDDEGLDVDDGVVLSPPEKRRKLYDGERSSLMDENCYADEKEPGQLEEEDFTHAPNISTSRWAYDDELDEGVTVGNEKEIKRRSSSPESGLTLKEGSDGSGIRSDGGCARWIDSDDECFGKDVENDDDMEVDASDDEDSLSVSESGADDDLLKPAVPENRKRSMLEGCRSVFEYVKLGKINEGSYGIVYKARDKKTGELVALKKLKMGREREGFPLYYLREINTLLAFDHPCVVNVREVVIDDSVDGFDNVYLVMDYVEHDLKALMQARKQPFTQSEVKCLMLQLLEGVKYLHDNWVLHRDLKTSNLLYNNKGELKVCDFGMARQYGSPLKPYTALVVTLWYRAPELLLGAIEYSTAVDMWSLGCIMAELLTNKPLFDGKTELEQLNKIYKVLGTPNDKIWPGYSQLPGARGTFAHQPNCILRKKFPRASFTGSPALSDLGLDLLSKLLTYDPEKRITVDEALNHRWFQEAPLPMPKDYMPTFPVEKVAMAR